MNGMWCLNETELKEAEGTLRLAKRLGFIEEAGLDTRVVLSLIHISEPTRPISISYAVFCLKKKNGRTLSRFYTCDSSNCT